MVPKTNCGIAAYAAKSKQVLKEATDDFRQEGEKTQHWPHVQVSKIFDK